MSQDLTGSTATLKINESKTLEERLKNGAVGLIAGLLGAIGATFLIAMEFDEEFGPRLFWIIAPIALGLIFFAFPGNHKFTLNEKGVTTRVGMRNYLYKWDSFQYYSEDNIKKKFQLKRKSAGSLELTTREHYDEAKQILSHYLQPKQ